MGLERFFVLYVALNQLLCAVLLFPWARRRETICGLMGRWRATGSPRQAALAGALCPWLDRLFHRRMETCEEIYHMEREARQILYPLR